MKKVELEYPIGSTPLDPDELDALIPDYISTQGELNSLERSNIADAYLWAERTKLSDLLSASFILSLHKRMFGQVWQWAGKQRKSNKNIGVSKERIMQELGVLLNDVEFWIQKRTFSNIEIAARFHHRLVYIHVFANGNGRHARLMTEVLLKTLGEEPFSWGSIQDENSQLETSVPTRKKYIAALKAADDNDFEPLIKFVRT